MDEPKAQQIFHDFESSDDRICFEQLLSFDRFEGDRLGECVDESRGFERFESGESLTAGDFVGRRGNELLERLEDARASSFEYRTLVVVDGFGIIEQLDARRSIESIPGACVLLANSKTMFAKEQDLEGPVGSLLRVNDPANTSDIEDRGIAQHVGDSGRLHGDHADQLAAVEGLARHLPISWLEDEEGDRELGQQDDIRERKEREGFDGLHSVQLSRNCRSARDPEIASVGNGYGWALPPPAIRLAAGSAGPGAPALRSLERFSSARVRRSSQLVDFFEIVRPFQDGAADFIDGERLVQDLSNQ